MTPLHKEKVNQIVSILEGLHYWEVLDIMNAFSAQIYICAPGNHSQLAIDECHRIQMEVLHKYLNEKETQKGIVDKAIVDFGEFASRKRSNDGESAEAFREQN
jgi:hypothetical protein